jgi:hypothetical protein
MDDATDLVVRPQGSGAPPCVGDNHHGCGFHHGVKTCNDANDADFSWKSQ